MWGLLFLLALTSVAFNLNAQIFRPVLTAVLPTSPSIRDQPGPATLPQQRIGWDSASAIANAEAARRGWPQRPVARISPAREQGFYMVRLGRLHEAGFGPAAVFVAMDTGRVLATERGGEGKAGDVVDALVYPIHSGQIAGLTGRILI